MDDKKLQQIQDELMKEMDKEQKIETEIVQSSEEIAANLILSKKCTADINGTQFLFNYRLLKGSKKSIIYMLVANTTKYKIAPEKYIPFTATAEMDLRYSEKDNLKTVVEAFIRHVTDRVKPETLED
jgi:ethanolamine ammonia-lyase small subunit